jgi:hypothetical protein
MKKGGAIMGNPVSPDGGWLQNAEGEIVNLVDLLGGGTPLSDKVQHPTNPRSGLLVGSDGKVYDITKMIGSAHIALPEPSAAAEGRIIQYGGPTTDKLTHGHFYECTGDAGGYAWVEISMAGDGGGLKATVVSETITFA